MKEEECAERVREMVEKIKASGERCWGGGKGRGRDGGEEVKSKRLKAESLTGDSGCAPSGAGGMSCSIFRMFKKSVYLVKMLFIVSNSCLKRLFP